MSNNDRDGDARGHFQAAPGRNRIPSPQRRRNNEFRDAVTNMARMIGEHRDLEQQRQLPLPGRSYPQIEGEIYRALAPVIGTRWQADLEISYQDENLDVGIDDDDRQDEAEKFQVDAAVPVNNNHADGHRDPEYDLQQTIAALREDPLIHRPEERNNPTLDRRLPGSSDAGFRPTDGDIILRICPPADGSVVEYFAGGRGTNTAPSAPLQAGDNVVRIFYDNLSTTGITVTYAELHLCVGNLGPPRLPEFLYFGRALQRMADV